MFTPCAIIPVYNHEQKLPSTIVQVLQHLPIILVDDGSNDACKKVIQEQSLLYKDVQLLSLEKNGGKGVAMQAGMRAAHEAGFSHALQIDADGQHSIDDIPRFLEAAKESPDHLIVGTPQYDSSIPKSRLYGHYLTHVWVWINTLSTEIKDSMCGFRVYPTKASHHLFSRENIGKRMDYDTDFIVKWYWSNRSIKQLQTSVTYPADGVSHFSMWKDNILISKMHARLFFGMLRRLPSLLRHKIAHKQPPITKGNL